MAKTAGTLLTCSVCGFQYNPAEHPSCGSCPLHKGCSMACCPNCGTTNINPAESRLANWIKSLLGEKHDQPTSILASTQHD